MPGKFVSLKDTVKSFKAIMDGELDNVGETAFYMVGGPEEILKKQQRLAEDAENMRLRQMEQEKRAADSNTSILLMCHPCIFFCFFFEELNPKE